jgi:hypothetical protein
MRYGFQFADQLHHLNFGKPTKELALLRELPGLIESHDDTLTCHDPIRESQVEDSLNTLPGCRTLTIIAPVKTTWRSATAVTAAVLLSVTGWVVQADEGMWLFNDPPRNLLKARHGFEPTDTWLRHVQRASIRFNNGGSGSFASADGLILSNHHVGADALQKLSDAEHDYLKDGFLARSRADEMRCVDLELNVLIDIEDVTARVAGAVKDGMPPEAALKARRAAMAAIEKESLERTGLRSDVVTLYQGGRYHLYRYKRYTDVRLVFAPEQQAAAFGGDPDNFEYPRYCLDMILFRAYEDGQPARVEDYLKWNPRGAAEGELVFVSGHPGSTSRSLTMTELAYDRDVRLPYTLGRLYNLEVLLSAYSARDVENERRARDLLLGVQNSRKALRGQLAGLLDPSIFGRKMEEETALRRQLASTDQGRAATDSWNRIEAAQETIARHALHYRLLEAGHAFGGDLFDIARVLVRAADELPKPNGERLPEFRDSSLDSLRFGLFSEKPIHDDLEQLLLSDSLTWFAAKLGATNALVQSALQGKSPRERAAELVRNTRVGDVDFRKTLFEGGRQAVAAANDPMLELARHVDDEARAVRSIVEAQDEVKKQAHAKIAEARFALAGSDHYPDATFTLRLAFGTVRGYQEQGESIPHETRLRGLYERAEAQGHRPPFDLPERWMERRESLDPSQPVNFVSTCDIIGGNSGSPVINRDAELVGLIFDGNIQSLVLDYLFTDEQARAIAVHPAAMIEALDKVYGADHLVIEILGAKND